MGSEGRDGTQPDMRHEATRSGYHGNLARFQYDQVSRKKLSLQTAVTNLSYLVQHEFPAFCAASYSRNLIVFLFVHLCAMTCIFFAFTCLKFPTFSLKISVYYNMHHFIIAHDMSGVLGLIRDPVSESDNSFTVSSTTSCLQSVFSH